MRGQVVAEKVRPPVGKGLFRRRLVGHLLCPQNPRSALVVAPAGCGKTTLLAQTATAAGVCVGWYRAEAGDAREADFVRHVAAALRDVLGLPAVHAVTEVDDLMRQLDAWPGDDGVLVVDDLHEISETPAERALGRLLELRPSRLRILLGSRRYPTFNFSRLRVADLLLQLDGDDLRFRSWEVERLFRDVYAEPLPPESAAVLTRRTEGWAAGLQLFHLATAGKTMTQRRAAVATLGGHSRLIRSYLADNVLAELAPGRRSFLTRTCALGLLTGALCDELLGAADSQSVLRDLEEAQLFTFSDDDGQTFRYHQVLQDHLEVVLREELGQAQTRHWFSRSARVLERAGHFREALRAHARAEDWASVSQLLTRAGSALAEAGHREYDGQLPPELREQDPWLALADARRRLRRGDVAGAVHSFRRAESLLPDPGFRATCRRERVLAATWLPQPPPQPARPLDGASDSRHWSERLRASTITLRHRPDRAAPADGFGGLLELGLVSLLAGQVRDARAPLAAVSDETEVDCVEHLAARGACGLLELLLGRSGTDQLEQTALAAEVAAQPWLERLTRAMLQPALQGRHDDNSLTSWSYLVKECESEGDAWGAALLRLAGGAAQALANNCPEPDWLDEAAVAFRQLNAPVLTVWADALRAVALARAGSPETKDVATQAERAARSLAIPGARALACWSLARCGSGPRQHEQGVLAIQLADECGFPLPAATRDGRGPAERESRSGLGPNAEIRLTLLGGFRLEIGGRVEEWSGVRPRALTLLRLLALSAGVAVHRERLVEALWPGVDVTTGTRRLQVAVSSVRQALDRAGLSGSETISRHGNAYRLSLPDAASLDVRELDAATTKLAAARALGERPAASAAAREVLALYRGELLPEDGPAEWVVDERDRLRLQVAAAARDLAENCLETGELAEGVGAALRSLELDRFQDRAWQLLAHLHERGGDHAAAAFARREQRRVAAELAAPAPIPVPWQRVPAPSAPTLG